MIKFYYFIIAGIFLLLAGFFLSINFFVLNSNKESKQSAAVDGSINNAVGNSATNDPVFNVNEEPNNELMQIESENKNINAYDIEVDWLSKLVPLCEKSDGCGDYETKKFRAGKIINGEFGGQDLYLMETPTMGGSDFTHYIILNGKEFILEDNKFGIKGISDLSQEIDFPNSSHKLERSVGPIKLFSEVKIVKKLFTIEGIGEFVLADDGCVIIELPNHTAQGYDIKVPFLNKENGHLDVVFDDGKKNEEEYTYREMRCGGACLAFQIIDLEKENIKPVERFTETGAAENRENIYEFKNLKDIRLEELYNDKGTIAYINSEAGGSLGKNKYTYDEFIGFHPLLYWRDPLGRWLVFRNKRFYIAAEMCKPVIYLYPERETKLNVQVDPIGGFTKTIPEYPPGGWDVTAHPDGKIIDNATGITYDYLYWSGISLGQFKNDEGWVVGQHDLGSFFDEKLKRLGMNEKEINDFKEYWLGRLIDKPFYQIFFLPKNIVDALAPLKITSVKEDAVLRIIMAVKGLDQFQEMPEQRLPQIPKRKGFTVVEWGGIIVK